MERIRAYYDADRTEQAVPTTYKTEQNQNELLCSDCGAKVFVDDLIFDDVRKMTEKTFDNPFLCEECLESIDESAHVH